jgi:hypothetical protein
MWAPWRTSSECPWIARTDWPGCEPAHNCRDPRGCRNGNITSTQLLDSHVWLAHVDKISDLGKFAHLPS